MEEMFAHGIGRADFMNGMVRLELVTMVPGSGPTPAVEPRKVLWLPLDGFLRSAATMEGLIGELAKAGIVRPGPSAASGPPAPAAASPNFPSAHFHSE